MLAYAGADDTGHKVMGWLQSARIFRAMGRPMKAFRAMRIIRAYRVVRFSEDVFSRKLFPVSKVRPGESMPEKGRWPNTQSPGLRSTVKILEIELRSFRLFLDIDPGRFQIL